MIDLKLMVQETLFKTFQEKQPELIKNIEECKKWDMPLSEVKKTLVRLAKKHDSSDDGNNLILLAEYVYSKPPVVVAHYDHDLHTTIVE